MRVSDLIKELEKQDPNAVVLMSADEEGNTFSPLAYGFGTVETEEEREVIGEAILCINEQDYKQPWIILYPLA